MVSGGIIESEGGGIGVCEIGFTSPHNGQCGSEEEGQTTQGQQTTILRSQGIACNEHMVGELGPAAGTAATSERSRE